MLVINITVDMPPRSLRSVRAPSLILAAANGLPYGHFVRSANMGRNFNCQSPHAGSFAIGFVTLATNTICFMMY